MAITAIEMETDDQPLPSYTIFTSTSTVTKPLTSIDENGQTETYPDRTTFWSSIVTGPYLTLYTAEAGEDMDLWALGVVVSSIVRKNSYAKPDIQTRYFEIVSKNGIFELTLPIYSRIPTTVARPRPTVAVAAVHQNSRRGSKQASAPGWGSSGSQPFLSDGHYIDVESKNVAPQVFPQQILWNKAMGRLASKRCIM